MSEVNKRIGISPQSAIAAFEAQRDSLIEKNEAYHKIFTEQKNSRLSDAILKSCIASAIYSNYSYYLFQVDNCIINYRFESNTSYLTISSEKFKGGEKVKERFVKALEVVEPEKEDEIYIDFWYRAGSDPTHYYRKIKAGEWSDIQSNYSCDTLRQLEPLFKLKKWDESMGKLILWRGDPGGGKTHALRALCREWKSWAKINYITDPEEMLNGPPDYLIKVCMEGNNNLLNLVVLEDSGELMTPDAHTKKGQGLSRLLNMADGMMGQGLNMAFLITTNEDIKKLHSAVARSGRCAFDNEFENLSIDEANDWLKNHDSFQLVEKETSLADLYAIINNNEKVKKSEKVKLGFV